MTIRATPAPRARLRLAALLALASVLVPGTRALAAAPLDPVLTYSGHLHAADGLPVTAATTITFRLYATPSEGTPLWEEPLAVLPGPDGWFSAVLGAGAAPLPGGLFAGPLWLALEVEGDGAEMAPRARLSAAPYAAAVEWAGVLNRPASFPSDWESVANKPATFPTDWAQVADRPASFPSSWADVTGKPAAFPSTWAEVSGKPSTYPVDPALVQARITGSCPTGQFVVAVAQDGTVTCGIDARNPGTVTQVTAAAPLSVANGTTTPTIAIPAATAMADGYLRASDFAGFNAKLAPGSIAGGDLAGTLPTPTVARVQGRPVATTAPAVGEVLRWNGTSWAPRPAVVCTTVSSAPATAAPGATTSASIACGAGTTLTGGGAQPSLLGGGIHFASYPTSAGWTAVLRNETGWSVAIQAHARCCEQ